MNSLKALMPIAFASIATSVSSAEEVKTIWQPGNLYHTHIAYEISIDNADLEPGAEKCYHGRYHIPHLMFAPVIEFRTADIVQKGENFYAQRFYETATETVSGLQNVKWKSDDWGINPRRWINAARRYRDEDIESLRELVREIEEREKDLNMAGKDATQAEKELSKLRKDFEKEEERARKDLEELEKHVDATKEGSKKRAKVEKKLANMKKKHEEKMAELQKKLDKAKNSVERCRSAVREAQKALVTEDFSVFYDTKHNPVPFLIDKQNLFLKWDGHSVENYFKGRQSRAIEVGIGPMHLSTANAVSNGWSKLIVPNPNIQNTIASEFGLMASAIFDDPDGKLRFIENRKKWQIDASNINGLLATKELKKLISFRGTLNVERFRVRPSDCERVGLLPFEGWKIRVMDSEAVEVGYDTGDGRESFLVTISLDGNNQIEFWFDANNEVLRYAKVEIVKEDYEGSIPNPNLGKMLSQVKGTAKGSVVFKCEYKTSVNQTLPGLDDPGVEKEDDK